MTYLLSHQCLTWNCCPTCLDRWIRRWSLRLQNLPTGRSSRWPSITAKKFCRNSRKTCHLVSDCVMAWTIDYVHLRCISFYLQFQTLIQTPRGVFMGGGGIWPWPPLANKIFVYIEKKLENLIGPLLCMSTSGQRKFAPPFRNPKYATADTSLWKV